MNLLYKITVITGKIGFTKIRTAEKEKTNRVRINHVWVNLRL